MRIAVCDNQAAAAEQIGAWVRRYGSLYGLDLDEIRCFTDPEQFSGSEEHFDVAFLGFGGPVGLRTAQQVRSRNRRCRIIMVDDTMEYARHGMRLHCTNFVLRPVEFRHIVQSMQLILGGHVS